MCLSQAELGWVEPHSMLLGPSLLSTRLASDPLSKNRGAVAGKSLASGDTSRIMDLRLLLTTAPLQKQPSAASD